MYEFGRANVEFKVPFFKGTHHFPLFSMALKIQVNSTVGISRSSWFTTNHNKDVILNITKKLLGSLNSMPINSWVSITTQL